MPLVLHPSLLTSRDSDRPVRWWVGVDGGGTSTRAIVADAEAVGRLADGVVVGSAFVRVIEKYAGTPELEGKLEALARELKTGALQGRIQ